MEIVYMVNGELKKLKNNIQFLNKLIFHKIKFNKLLIIVKLYIIIKINKKKIKIYHSQQDFKIKNNSAMVIILMIFNLQVLVIITLILIKIKI